MTDLDIKKYPIGKFQMPNQIPDIAVEEMITELKNFPAKVTQLVEQMDDAQLDTPYREGGWTVRQLVNHLADSHMNSFLRFKLALTEEHPTIRPYDEKKFAELSDSRNIPVKHALQILCGVHQRWAFVLKSLTNKQFDKTFFHPGNEETYTLRQSLAHYIWHGNHHLAHIQNLKKEMNW